MRFGPYEAVTRLGEGGMGEVYRGRDPRLQRDVAIKVLRGAAVQSTESRARFETEARAASALNHPNILTVHDIGDHDGQPYMVTELIEGETLRTILEKGPIATKRLLDIAVQISSGLAAAHGAGITHRDLKPENLMLTRDGHLKILDFGLAKVSQPARTDETLTDAAWTEAGSVMGTAAYMSPEQARGAVVDFRSDQFSAGLILHEMATGKQTFRRATQAESMTAILREDAPPLDSSRPAPLRWIVERLLAKDPDERYASTKDIHRDLRMLREHLGEAGSGTVTAQANESAARQRSAVWTAALAAGALATGGLVGWLLRAPHAPVAPAVNRFTIPADNPFYPIISPDGRHLVYQAGPKRALYIRDFDKNDPREIPGTAGSLRPFWSPDSKQLAFNLGPDLVKIPVTGGQPVVICKLPSPDFFTGAWSPDGEVIVFGARPNLYQVPARGGTPKVLVADKPSAGVGPRDPSFLPIAGRHVILYCDGTGNDLKNYVRDIESGEVRPLGLGGQFPAYTRSGLIIVQRFGANQSLWAVPFSLDKLRETGEPFPVTDSMFVSSVSDTDTLAYIDPGGSAERQLVLRDRSGRKTGFAGTLQNSLADPAISPDGTRIAVSANSNGNVDIWIHQVGRPVKMRLTTHQSADRRPVWSPQGDRLVLASARSSRGKDSLWVAPVDGGGTEAELLAEDNSYLQPSDWARNGVLVFTNSTNHQSRVSYLNAEDPKAAAILRPVPEGQIWESDGHLSPDGRFLAFTSNESGSAEIHLRRFPEGTGKWQVSTNGGVSPRWRRDGREIFYRSGRSLMAAPVTRGKDALFGTPVELFQLPANSAYDAFPDGQQFVVAEPVGEAQPRTLRIVQNWSVEFRDRLGGSK